MTSDLEHRYGSAPSWRRPVTVSLVVLVAGVALGWLVWTAWFHSTPAVESSLLTFTVSGDHKASAKVRVTLEDDVEASCRLRAYAEDHSPVGEKSFVPVDGYNEVEIRTERRATSVEMMGCTAPGQKRPR